MEIYKGASAFAGIAIGKIRFYRKGEYQIRQHQADDVKKELKNFDVARRHVMQTLKEEYDRMSEKQMDTADPELDMEPLQVYRTYHNLWKIEESFRITKSYLDARPVYEKKKETIYGHFLICYLSLFLLRILEIKCFKNEINSYDLVNFMRDFRAVDKGDGTNINISQNQNVNEKIKKLIGLTNLDALYLTEKEIENIFEFTMLIDS